MSKMETGTFVKRIGATVVAMGMSSSVAHAALVPNIPFDTEDQYTNNFLELGTNTANIGYSSANQNVRYAPSGNNGTALLRYDTTPVTMSPVRPTS
ncbi:MAG TPA: hypothetical protein VGN72_09800 [Tepidisphaeraceae bacterium]|jgi:hypothetical protein|nr:hypothetical protein [Tepidisphaeraceae bacterium]